MARIYSYLFEVGQVTPGGFIDVVPDPAFVYVVRDITGVLRNTNDITLRFHMQIDTFIPWEEAIPGIGTQAFSWQGHIVLPNPPGFRLATVGVSGTADFIISGYKLG
jgi:hypothetical protein